MKKQILVLLVLVLFITGLSCSQYISDWPNMISSNIANDDMVILEDESAADVGTYFNITVAALATKLLGGATIGGTSAGDIVTIDDTQTLTNKTLTSPVINGGAIYASTFGAMTIAGNVDHSTGYFYIYLNHSTYDYNIRTPSNTNTFFIDGSNGYIGINTSTPSAELDIIGTLKVTGEAKIDNIGIDGNTISSTNLGGDINILPNSTGLVVLAEEDLKIGSTQVLITGNEMNTLDGTTGSVAGLEQGLGRVLTTITFTSNSYTLTDDKAGSIQCNTVGGTGNLYMPEIDSKTAGIMFVIQLTAGANAVTIYDNAADAGFSLLNADDGQVTGTTLLLEAAGDFVLLMSSGFETGRWIVMGGYSVNFVP